MLSPQDKGRLFEKCVHYYLEKTNITVLSEAEIKRKYGMHITAIDHLIELDSYIICIQDKYEKKTISVDKIRSFSQCVTDIHNKTYKRCYGIYLSKKKL